VTWGFTTCYSSIGGPLEGDRMERNADLRGVPASRTLERQWGEVAEMGKEMAETLKSAMLRHPGRREHCEIKTTGSCWTGKSRLVAKGTAEDLELFSRWFSTFLPAWQKEMALIAAARMLDECGVKNFAAAATPLRLLPAANEKFAAVGIAI
jgi:hypothetical protein